MLTTGLLAISQQLTLHESPAAQNGAVGKITQAAP
jgi:hypothetical protein